MRNLSAGSNMASGKWQLPTGGWVVKNWPCAVLVCICCAATGAKPAPTATPAPAPTAAPTAAFDFGLVDTSLPGEMNGTDPAEQQRLAALNAELSDMLVKSGCCSMVDLRPVAQQAHGLDLRTCNGCDVALARAAGAKISVTGWVQKVSNLILNINLVARDVTTGAVIEAGSVDIRGNTNESWSRGLSYLLRNRLHPSNWR
jgi:Protein of unknown function (DUF2380)